MKDVIYHTSPDEITKISDCSVSPLSTTLCFSVEEYAMGDVTHVYRLECDVNKDFIRDQFLYDEDGIEDVIKDVSETFDRYFCHEIDFSEAEDLLCSKCCVEEILHANNIDAEWEDVAQVKWHIQHCRVVAARKLGFLGCKSMDEQGCVYLVDMLNRENLLILDHVK